MILDTPGGVVEVVERMVTALRHVYRDLAVIVPDRAMSAGTIFALSADRIMMDHLSSLGPIDPQIERDWSGGASCLSGHAGICAGGAG